MSQKNAGDTCSFCNQGRLVKQTQHLSFNQWTDRGYVFCSVDVPVQVCESCGSKTWDDAAESLIEEAVWREYDKPR